MPYGALVLRILTLSDLKKTAVMGVQWMTVATVILIVTQMLSTAILVRLLNKSDFGLMALVMVVKGFADIFMDFGITVAILHKQDLSQNQYSSLYWLNMIIGVVIYAVICVVTPLVASFYNEYALLKLIPIMCLAIPFSSIGRQQKTLLQKEFFFKSIAVTDIISAFLGLALAVYFAYTGWGVYALVFSNLGRYIIGNIIYLFLGFKLVPIKFHFKLSETIPALRIGGFHTVSQVINYFTCSFDVLIIGRLLGTDSLGIYNLAKDLVTKPSALVAPIASKVATPIFSKIQNDAKKLYISFFSVQKIISYLNGFVYLGVFALASPFVSFYYGVKYLECVPMIQVLAVYYFIRQYDTVIGIVCVAKGRTDVDMWWNILVVCIMPLTVFVGAHYSIMFVTVCLLLLQIILTYPAWLIYTKRLLDVCFFQYYVNLIKTIIIFILPITISLLLIYLLNFSAIMVFLIVGFAFISIAFAVLLLFEKEFLISLKKNKRILV